MNDLEKLTKVVKNQVDYLIFVGTQAQWDALSATEQNKYLMVAIT